MRRVNEMRWGQMRGFQEAMNKVGLVDLGMIRGNDFTWSNRRDGSGEHGQG